MQPRQRRSVSVQDRQSLSCILLVFWIALANSTGYAQDSAEAVGAASLQNQPDPNGGFSGYAKGSAPLEGRDSVVQDLFQDDQNVGSVWKPKALDGTLDPWWNAKRKLKENYGLKLQLSYQSLRMWLDDSPGDDRAAAGRFEFQGAWMALGRGTANTSTITFRLEYRNTLGTDLPPSQLGIPIGSQGLVGTGFSDFGWQFRELAWRQTIGENWKFATGKISSASWYNNHALSSPKRGFQNSAFLGSNTRPFPGRGFGFVGGVRLGQRWALAAGIHDANAKSDGNPFDTIDEKEFFQSVELHYFLSSFDRHRWDQVRVQLWHQDERKEAGVASGQGITFMASKLFGDRYMPFAMGGYSDGDASQLKADITLGIGFAFNTKHRAARDILGIGANWGEPSNNQFQDQYTGEIFYRFQLLKNIAFTPSFQYIKNPIANPEEASYWLFGFRWRMTF